MDSAFGNFMHQVFGGFDMAIFSFFAGLQSDPLNAVATFLSAICSSKFIFLVCAMALVMALFKKTRRLALYIGLSLGFAVLFSKVIFCNMCCRLRPYNALQASQDFMAWYQAAGSVHESVYSFPSGHTTASFALGTVLFLYVKCDKKKLIGWIFLIIPFFVGLSRIYLMVHYPTDVLAGIFFGALSGFIAYLLTNWILRTLPDWPGVLCKLDNIDLEVPIIKLKGSPISKTLAIILITIGFLLCFALSLMSATKPKPECQYTDITYTCHNKAEDDQVFNQQTGQWENRCKLHEKK